MERATNSDKSKDRNDLTLVTANLREPWTSRFREIQKELSHGGIFNVSCKEVITYLVDHYETSKKLTNGQKTNHADGQLVSNQ